MDSPGATTNTPLGRVRARREHLAAGSAGPVPPLLAWSVLVALSAGALVGPFSLRGGPRLLLPVAVAAALVWSGPAVVERLPWSRLLVAVVVAAGVWAVALALVDGPEGVTAPLENGYDYLHDVPRIGDDPGAFLASFTDRIASFSAHVRAHPPGMLLTLWTLDRAGLGGAAWAAALVIIGGASVAAAALISVRAVGGEHAARRVAPFLALMPAAVWIASSADALYMGVSAWAVALVVVATGRRGRRSDLTALAGGLVAGLALFLSYGVALLAAVVALVAARRRRIRPLVFAAAGIGVVAAAFALAGFWWLDGLSATAAQYAAGAAGDRSYVWYLVLNVGAFAVALGPAAAVAIRRLRGDAIWLLAAGGLAAALLADVSGMSKGEVERIWLPFVPWALTACAALAGRGWLALQAATGVTVQMMLRSPW